VLGGEGSFRRGFGFGFIDDFLVNVIGQDGRSGSGVGKKVRSHLRADMVGFLLKGIKHGDQEHDIFIWDKL
jgi:hypothetical protein